LNIKEWYIVEIKEYFKNPKYCLENGDCCIGYKVRHSTFSGPSTYSIRERKNGVEVHNFVNFIAPPLILLASNLPHPFGV
jgi:hypothetical protein